MARRWTALALILLAAMAPAAHAAATSPLLPPSFTLLQREPGGGTVWQGRIDLPGPRAWFPTLVYLPPGAAAGARYPVAYVLHGLAGSPYSLVNGLGLPQTADSLIAAHVLPPFVAVMPSAGTQRLYRGEWTGPWEQEVLATVKWADATLPVLPSPRARSIMGLSAGGFGAIDFALRHPGFFGTAEAWSGYFTAPHDGSLAHADAATRRANDPSLLVAGEAPTLRRLGTRFFLSSGSTSDPETAGATRAFAAELTRLGLPHRVALAPGGHDGRFWRSQLPDALSYALAGT